MGLDTWDRLVALVPPPSQSVGGRKIEARTGTLLQVKAFLTQEGASLERTLYDLACSETFPVLYNTATLLCVHSPVTMHDPRTAAEARRKVF